MSSEVQRLYFEHPNVYVWNQDLAQIHDAGLNMIRTGWWTGWDKFSDENGQPYERTLRTIEAYLMTARKYGLPVQFNFFAFLPDVLGGANRFPRSLGGSPSADFDFVGRRALPRRSLPRMGSHQRAELLAAPLEDAPQRRRYRTRAVEQLAEPSLSRPREARRTVECSSRFGRRHDLASSAKTSSYRAACTPEPTRFG